MYIVWSKKWTKWELVEEGKSMIRKDWNPILSDNIIETSVIVDVYKRLNNKTGIYKYKQVERK